MSISEEDLKRAGEELKKEGVWELLDELGENPSREMLMKVVNRLKKVNRKLKGTGEYL